MELSYDRHSDTDVCGQNIGPWGLEYLAAVRLRFAMHRCREKSTVSKAQFESHCRVNRGHNYAEIRRIVFLDTYLVDGETPNSDGQTLRHEAHDTHTQIPRQLPRVQCVTPHLIDSLVHCFSYFRKK